MASTERRAKRKSADRPSLAKVEQYLAGLDFPAGKIDVISYAAEGKASQDVLDTLAKIPDRVYGGPTELSKEITPYT